MILLNKNIIYKYICIIIAFHLNFKNKKMTSIIAQLRTLTEATVGKSLNTPKDFTLLSERIYERLHQHISPTTLKRVWGYQQDEGPARPTTFNILAQFCGYANWDSFKNNAQHGESQSATILSRFLKTEDIEEGTQIQLCWAPNRICNIEYMGNNKFKVLSSLNAKLQPGNTFECNIFIDQEPLYVYNLVREANQPTMSYYAGRKDGIRFEVINKEQNKLLKKD